MLLKEGLLSFVICIAGAVPAWSQAQAKFSFEGVADCERPAVRDYPVTGEGTGILRQDRSANFDVTNSLEGRRDYSVELGKKSATPDDVKLAMRVTGRRSLRVEREYPNNVMIFDLKVRGSQCSLTISNRLKPGQKLYTFQTYAGLAYCTRVRINKTTCEVLEAAR